MTITTFQLTPDAWLYQADCRDVLRALPENSLDSCVCDPPYHLTSVVKRFGGPNAAPAKHGTDGLYARQSRGFMQTTWDGGDIAFDPETWALVLRVLKPGAHLVAFGAPRGYHRMACAIEDAGFEIRDSLMWIFGTGFPKSHDVSKGIDKRKDWKSLALLGDAIKTARTKLGLSQTEAARRVGLIGESETLGGGGFMWFETGRMPTREEWPRIKDALALGDGFDESFEAAEREVIGTTTYRRGDEGTWTQHTTNDGSLYSVGEKEHVRSIARNEQAAEWEGWGTALKPAFEPIILARKPLSEPTVAANVLRWRTGAINIDACRVGSTDKTPAPVGQYGGSTIGPNGHTGIRDGSADGLGRWPANLVLSYPEGTFTVNRTVDATQRAELEAWLAANT